MKSKKLNQENEPPSALNNSLSYYKIIPISVFVNQALSLKEKYPNIKDDFLELHKRLKVNPIVGNTSLGKNCYKVRMQISDKNAGQSGGARLIIEVKIKQLKVYLLTVYDKSHQENILEKEMIDLINKRESEFGNN